MNTRHCVHFASQDSVRLNSLTVLYLRHNELKSISTYHRLTINNDVGYRFVLGCQQPDCSTGRVPVVRVDDRNSFGKCVVGGVHFHQLRADKIPFFVEDGNPQTVEVGVKIEKKRPSVGSGSIDRY